MEPDQTVLSGLVKSGFIVFASIIKSSLNYIQIYAADIISGQDFQDKNIGK